ncbi:MAG: hypothetical protein Ct9H90mP16_09700 [Candidatus Poseidoniales archaeon]|nr:MAG: hypothetical protein Ct9H90mP16_09700 [Candidatus Poseidoniales archaeon]
MVAEGAQGSGSIGDAEAIWNDADNSFKSVPSDGEYSVREDAVYLHYTSNNTLYGTQYHHLPDSSGKPRILDASSDIAGVPLDVSAHEVIYAGAQKNLGPSGVTLVILSPWAMERCGEICPRCWITTCMLPRDHCSTPPIHSVFLFLIRCSSGWKKTADWKVPSHATVPKPTCSIRNWIELIFGPPCTQGFTLGDECHMEIEQSRTGATFLQEAEAAGPGGLKGHRSVGGIRASLYNGCPMESVVALVDFMREFSARPN